MFRVAILILVFIWGFSIYLFYDSTYFYQKINEITYNFELFYVSPDLSKFLNLLEVIIYYYSTYFISAVYFLTGIYAYTQRPTSIIIRNFFYLMSVIGTSITFSKPSSLNLSMASEIELLSISLIPYFLILFFEYFPYYSERIFIKKTKYFLLGYGIVINILYYISLFILGKVGLLLMLFIKTALVIQLVFSIYICLYLLIKLWKSNNKWIHNQLIILLGSLIVAFSPILLLSIIPGSLFNLSTIPFSYSIISIILLPLTLAYLLIKQEVLDFNKSLNTYKYNLLGLLLIFTIINILLCITSLNFKQITYQNLLLILAFLLYGIFGKIIDPIKSRNLQNKFSQIQEEKQRILQEINSKKFLQTCAEHIVKLIHKMVDVNGACIVWGKNEPLILYDSGLFDDKEIANGAIKPILEDITNNVEFVKKTPYNIFPILRGGEIFATIIVGQKRNLTAMDKEEIALLKKIQSEVLDLFINVQRLQKVENEFKSTQHSNSLIDYFNSYLLNELETERKNLSVFLHDDILQNLILLLKKLQELPNTVDVQEFERYLLYYINEIREMCNNLHPVLVEDLGLEISLKSLVKKTSTNHDILVNLNYNTSQKIIPNSLSIHVFRIIKELINNAIKHASATEINVYVEVDNNNLIIKIIDNGKGFNPPDSTNLYNQNNMGLMTVKKKVNQLQGIFDIYSTLDIGTTITITVPIKWSDNLEKY